MRAQKNLYNYNQKHVLYALAKSGARTGGNQHEWTLYKVAWIYGSSKGDRDDRDAVFEVANSFALAVQNFYYDQDRLWYCG